MNFSSPFGKRILILFVPVLMTFLFSCTPILSKHTDVQAWIEYHHEQKMKRAPAELVKAVRDANPLSVTAKKELDALLDVAPIRGFILSCAGDEACYQAKLTLYFDQSYQKAQSRVVASLPGKMNSENYKSEQKQFFREQAYPLVLEEIHGFHELLLSGLSLRASDHIRELNSQCESAKEVEGNIEFGPFLGGIVYIPKNIYACLNSRWLSDADQLFSETTDRLGVIFASTDTNTSAQAKDWIIQHEIYPVYTQETHRLLQKKQTAEMALWPSELKQLTGKSAHSPQCLVASVKQWAPVLREKYHYLNLESLLTDFFTQECKNQS